MAHSENSLDDSVSNGDLNESDLDSEGVSVDDMSRLESSAKIDPVHRQLYESLRQQEREEREEIERELKAHKQAMQRQHEIQLELAQVTRENGKDRSQSQSPEAADMLDLRTPNNNRLQLRQESPPLQPSLITNSERLSPLATGALTSPARDRPSIMSHHDIKTDRLPYESLQAATSIYDRYAPPPPSRSPATSDPPSESGHHWTFEEQFKQLYELSDDPKRKEFLDDLFSFMQKRGTPVNRIPIMAKQVLDLYELFRLVVSKGGLVEVINRKLWREITKGLNLPSSITSAAFTLRTQYMKYLYPYECEKLKLSNPGELQSAIDGNRREGRRASFGYDISPTGPPTLVPPPAHAHLNGSVLNGKMHHSVSPINPISEYNPHKHYLESVLKVLTTGDSTPTTTDSARLSSPTPLRPISLQRTIPERDHLAMEAANRAMEEATRKMEAASRASMEENQPPRKRMALEDEQRLMSHAAMSGAHLKITSRNDGRSEIDNSLVVSMEINGIMYQGVLFAQIPRRI
ncbi:AT-rich interactive domain-containing protein 3C-like [Tubulanus polymorphus]|uniref:AT-rich interactive domain-containing protein 3C-like n=1 Tax=Tubulanus polymorphus TaxID=672921 RepID=UPI003DA43B6D